MGSAELVIWADNIISILCAYLDVSDGAKAYVVEGYFTPEISARL